MDAKWKNPDYLVRYLTRGYFTILFFMMCYIIPNMLAKDIPTFYNIRGDAMWNVGIFSALGTLMITAMFLHAPYDTMYNGNDIFKLIRSMFRFATYIVFSAVSITLIVFDLSMYHDAGYMSTKLVWIYHSYINLSEYVMYLFLIVCILIPIAAHILGPFNKRDINVR